MNSPKQSGKTDEIGDLTLNARLHDSSARYAVDAWENDGGSSAALRGEFDAARTALADIKEDRILRCLGAAVIMRWNTIPTKLQRELFDNASSVGELLQVGALKGQIARFLHKHKDDTG
jgi:hypothetical protein